MEIIKLQIPANTIYLKSIRLLTASLASDMGFDIEKVEDIRVVVSEACNMKMNKDDIKIKFILDRDFMQIEVIGEDKEIDTENISIQKIILEQLADRVEIENKKIKLTKEK